MNITILMNLHQVDVAIRYSDRIIGIREGDDRVRRRVQEAQEEDRGGDLRLRSGGYTFRGIPGLS